MLFQIGQLKDELRHKKQETKQDRLRLEQMQLEASFLKNQQKEQDRSAKIQYKGLHVFGIN